MVTRSVTSNNPWSNPESDRIQGSRKAGDGELQAHVKSAVGNFLIDFALMDQGSSDRAWISAVILYNV